MAVTATIKGTAVPIKVGWVLRDHYNEILDGGTIVIPQTNKLNIRPYDEVVLTGSPLTAAKTYLIAHYTERQIAFTPVAKYEYTVSLVSKTIKLQRIFLPNVSITQPRTGPGITIAQAIQRYTDVYGEKKLQTIGIATFLVNKFTLSTNITGLTALVPEFTLSKPNLFELFNTILARENKIIRLRGDDVLDVFDLTVKFDPIDTSKLTYTERTENGAEYLSETEIEFFNVLTDNTDSDAGFDLPIETTIRADASILNTENASLLLDKPIYKIISVKYLHVTREDQQTGDIAYKEFDITSYVLEKTEYETLTTNPLVTGVKKYERIYYTQGNNKIEGLMYRPFSIFPEAIFQVVSLATGGDGLLGGLSISPEYGIGRFLFRVKYIPQNDAKMRTSKYKGEPYPAITIDGQKANYGNLDLIADEQFKNAQRIGQPEITITASRYTSETQVPKLGDFLGEFILTSREISWNDGFIIFKGTLSKDYVNKTMFTGVTSKRRLYEIASGSESISRHDLIKIYYEFSRSVKTKPNPSFIFPANYNLNILTGNNDQKPVAVIIRTFNKTAPDTYTAVTTYAILKETIEQVARNSVLWSFEMQDNFSAGLKQDGAVTGGTALRYVKYVNDVGRFDYITLRFINKPQAQTIYQIPAKIGQVLVDWANGQQFMDYALETDIIAYIQKFQALPEIPTTDIPAGNLLQVQKEIWKDNREITKITIQHEFVADDLDIVVGEQMTKANRLFKNTTTTRRFYYSTTEKYNIYENEIALGSNTGTNLIFINYTNGSITINTSLFTLSTTIPWTSLKSWAIATNTGGLILGVNKKENETSPPNLIYLNIIENRYV
jgi:hypothetical protein